jgi:alpha-D-xyloside xylohydrolase
VYLPKGKWINYQNGEVYESGWHHLKAGRIPAIILVRDGAVIPHANLAQSTKDIDWNNLQLVVYSTENNAKGYLCLPSDNILHELTKNGKNGKYSFTNDRYHGKLKWTVQLYREKK